MLGAKLTQEAAPVFQKSGISANHVRLGREAIASEEI